jgi:protein-tyrosine phosphatase
MDRREPIRVCFVCLGNICRSPTAEAILRHLLAEEEQQRIERDGVAPAESPGRIPIEVESAGTGDWHVGELRDRRSRAVGERRGIPLSGRARQFTATDFARFHHVVAMDRKNLADLQAMAPDAAARAKLSLLRAHGPEGELDVPDPYDGGEDGFDRVFDICLAGCRALLAQVRRDADAGPDAAPTS